MQIDGELRPIIKRLASDLRAEAAVLSGEDRSAGHVVGCENIARRIMGYAKELARTVADSEPSAEMLAARQLAANVIGRMVTLDIQRGRESRIRIGDDRVMTTAQAVQSIVAGDQDDSDLVQDMLLAIECGRGLAADGYAKQRADETPAPYSAPGSLTVTLEGPQGCGKTLLANWLINQGQVSVRASYQSGRKLFPRIIEIGSDGRRFDVRNEEYLDVSEGVHG